MELRFSYILHADIVLVDFVELEVVATKFQSVAEKVGVLVSADSFGEREMIKWGTVPLEKRRFRAPKPSENVATNN